MVPGIRRPGWSEGAPRRHPRRDVRRDISEAFRRATLTPASACRGRLSGHFRYLYYIRAGCLWEPQSVLQTRTVHIVLPSGTPVEGYTYCTL